MHTFCFKSKNQLLNSWAGQFYPKLLEKAKIEDMRVCSKKECVRSIDGKTFLYSDGSSDFGKIIKKYKSEIDNKIIIWTENS